MTASTRTLRLALSALLLTAFATTPAEACCLRLGGPPLAGQVIDCTANHGFDRRIESKALGRKADLYVYLPPGYDEKKAYPLAIYLHGGMQDERGFLEVVRMIDQSVVCGELPAMIVAAPDGSLCGSRFGSFFVNSDAGKYQDWVVQDVFGYVTGKYKVRPEPEAHILVGVSMGGLGAYNIGLKHRDTFKTVIGLMPPLNLRWVDRYGCYQAPFDPHNWGWRDPMPHPGEVVARFGPLGIVKIRAGEVFGPVFGYGSDAIHKISEENPIELIDRLKVKKGEVAMYVAYAGRDQFNLDAQAQSFVYFAEDRDLDVTAACYPRGKHSESTAAQMFPGAAAWLKKRLETLK